MKKSFSKIFAIAGIALLSMIFVHPVVATSQGDCSVDYPTNPVPVNEGKLGKFRFKISCDTNGWSEFQTFRYKYTTQQDSAKGSVDYRGKAGVHVFYPARGPNYTRTTTVTTLADSKCESDEKFRIRYHLQGKTDAGWTDYTRGWGGLVGGFVVVAKIKDKC